MSKEHIENTRAFLKRWTSNGKKLIINVGENFWSAGGNRRRCSILFPLELSTLEQLGVIKKFGIHYRFKAV